MRMLYVDWTVDVGTGEFHHYDNNRVDPYGYWYGSFIKWVSEKLEEYEDTMLRPIPSS